MDNNLNLWSGIELTWENILARTFYGTDIYSHILQTYYPHDFLMHVKGDDCGWVRNPWDWSRPSLHIEIRKMDPKAKLPPRMAVHHDESRHIPDGNVIDFARMHWKLEGAELLMAVNEALNLNLGIDIRTGEYLIPSSGRETIFSYFKAPEPIFGKRAYTFDQFLNEIVRPNQNLRLVHVKKKRYIYVINGAIVEIADTDFDGVLEDANDCRHHNGGDDGHDGDGAVLAIQEGVGAFENRARDFLHGCGAFVPLEDVKGKPDRKQDRRGACRGDHDLGQEHWVLPSGMCLQPRANSRAHGATGRPD